MSDSYFLGSFPNCDLFKILSDKVTKRVDIDFNFFGKLDDFRKRVSQEVRQINELFPEYTPHDEYYHLSRLFHVADTILGRDRFELMNSSELYVLALALYGHDWGMAVSAAEKKYIITGEIDGRIRVEDLWILSDDRIRFTKFLREHKVNINSLKSIEDLNISLWSEYVRQTHALRSGVKVQRFFETIDGGVAEAVARVCVGHWLDIEKIADYYLYPMDFSVLRENINLRALAIYLRLIDLLDIAQDRTPYVIWKYVAPRDSYSKMEWKKHRALQPITCPKYQEGRIIRVDGSTDDHNVYAALEDLRLWCEDQFKQCNNVLARMNDQRHSLDIYHIDWRVAARGFKPISVQFEFERNRMFEILSSEIYKNNPYVFLRELLQNSIDAIRTRCELLKQKKAGIDGVGAIRVKVEHKDNGDSIVVWQDDGIGMDEYVVRNYLAVAGKSYYSSTDFEREGLNIDPISKFGVGILSCFMVADHIEIVTYKDPYMLPQSDPLRIIIPNMRQQFRVEVISPTETHYGTTFTIYVDGSKLKTREDTIERLNVTDCIAYIAGFVEFPIVIEEGERKTIVLHPHKSVEYTKKLLGINDEFEFKQIDLKYPIEKVFYAQDIDTVNEVLSEIRYDINKDLGNTHCEGIISFLAPKDNKTDIINTGRCWPTNSIKIKEFGNSTCSRKEIRWNNSWTSYFGIHNMSYINNENFSDVLPYKVFRDGILLTDVIPPDLLGECEIQDQIVSRSEYWIDASLPIPLLIVNLYKEKAPKIDIVRTEILGNKHRWDYSIWDNYRKYLLNSELSNFDDLSPFERFYKIANMVIFRKVSVEILWKHIDEKKWPIPFLCNAGSLNTNKACGYSIQYA